jgi:hypothetical protein
LIVSLELLRAAARLAPRSESRALLPGILRFSLEYEQAPALASAQSQIERLLGADGFDLFPLPSGEDANVLILQFPASFREQSPSFLFQTAAELVDALALKSCVPDVDPGWRAEDEMGRDTPESVGGIVWALCKSNAPAPADPLWALKLVKADKAWTKYKTRGEGILIGQPDTGVADHRELDGALEMAAGTDVIRGTGAPVDPLTPDMSSPGHGTATSSTVVSRQLGRISGTAPGARVVPIRCVNNVVISSGAAIATAIDHARRKSCDIVSMSLGGPVEFRDLERSIARAVNNGMIVLAAAGNCVGGVVYPAFDRNVIAVAGVDAKGNRWNGSSHGDKVDVSAPGENVYVARRTTPADATKTLVEPGQGTSFAVAITAGCAALWLARHTRQKVRAEASRRGVSVQALFRAALRQTAHAPAGWPYGELGAGIVDAEKLLDLALDAIAIPGLPPPGHPLAEALGSDFDWARHGAEASWLAFQAHQRRDPARIIAVESPVAPRPSEQLFTAVRRAGRDPDALFGAPAVVSSPITPAIGPARALTIITSKVGTAESAGAVSENSARSYLQGSGINQVVDLFERVLAKVDPVRDANPAVTRLRDAVRNTAPQVLGSFAAGARSSADFEGVARFTAEALIRLTGRPTLRVVNGTVERDNPQIGDWAGDVYIARNQLRPIVEATGRIDIDVGGRWIHVGTGIVTAPGVVMTNRHVIDAFAEPIPMPGGKRDFVLTAPASINFDEKAQAPDRRFTIKRVITAGRSAIGRHADVSKLDMAFLEVETTNAANKPLPDRVRLGALPPAEDGPMNIAVVGYPAKPDLAAIVDPDTGEVSDDMADRLWELFQNDYGHKYLSPGEIGLGLGALAGDLRRWAFTHDSTTLAGNSGSCVIRLGAQMICGLHFGGAPKRQNLAHGLVAVRDIAAGDPSWIDRTVLDGLSWT